MQMISKKYHGTTAGAVLFTLLFTHFASSSVRAEETKATRGINSAQNSVTSVKRDPFWPVGYVPESVKAAAEAKKPKTVVKRTIANDWNTAMKNVAINGVSSKNKEFYAVINGRIKSVGDTVTVKHEGMVYTWSVESIKPPGSVKLRRVSAH